jgi:maltooligosyltrehalose trehalohydrolase
MARGAARGRSIIVIGENEPQNATLVTEYGLDALWNDDFHHNAFVRIAGNNQAYLSGYRGTPQEFVSAAKYGFLYQGQHFAWQKNRRGTSALRLAPKNFIAFLESHDQVANLARGRRRHQLANPGLSRALKGLLLLSPQTVMLFQGEEFGSTSPFAFFAGHSGDLAKAVHKGRGEFCAQFPDMKAAGIRAVPDPADPDTMHRCRLDWSERDTNQEWLSLHRDLLRIRREDPVISQQRGASSCALDGAVIAPDAFCLRYFADGEGDRLLIVNLGIGLDLAPAPEPLLAPPPGKRWKMLWSSESVEYGGYGTPPLDAEGKGFRIPAQVTVLLAARDVEEGRA